VTLRRFALNFAALAALAVSGCTTWIESARLDRSVTAKGEGIELEATSVGFDLAVALHGTDENTVFVTELTLHNRRNTSLVVSLERVTLGVDRGAAQAVSAMILHPIAGGTGSLPSSIGTFNVAPPVSLAPGQHQKVWVAFKNVGTDDDHVTYGLTVHVPVDGSKPLVVKLSDPAMGGPRWTFNQTRGSLSPSFTSFGLSNGADTFGFSPGLSAAETLPWYNWSTRLTVGPLFTFGGTDEDTSGVGFWARWQCAFPLPFRVGKTASLAPIIGVDLARMSYESDVRGAEPRSSFARGYNVGLSLLIDVPRAFLGSFPLEPHRSSHGRTLNLTVGAMHTWNLHPGNTPPAAGLFASFGFGLD